MSWAGYPCKDASKYTLAAKEAEETIDSSSFFGMGLVNDFGYLWDKPHLYNSESVFSLFCNDPVLQNQSEISWGTWPGFYFGTTDSSSSTIRISRNKSLALSFYPVEINFYNNFPTGYRKEITFYTTVYYNNSHYDTLGNIIHTDTGYIDIEKVNPCSRIAYRKFYYEPYEKVNYPANYSGSKDSTTKYEYYLGVPRIYIFRYAQTMLTYAEAIARSGQINEKAYECINQIRRRAHHLNLNSSSVYDLTSGLTPIALADTVVQERAWELCGEPEGRWFDLVRLEMVEDLPKLRYPTEGGPPATFDKSSYYLSIPAYDTILNPKLGK